jgi:hypothetical protein
VEKKSEEESVEQPTAGVAWTIDEVRLIVADYFEMLLLDLADKPFNKAERNPTLREQLTIRNRKSVEFKHQNISAALLEMGLPYVGGYRPAKNYQKRLLPQVIEEYLDAHPEFLSEVENPPVLNLQTVPAVATADVSGYFEKAPERIVVPPAEEKPWLSRKGRRIDYVQRDAKNRALGRLGEEFSLSLEKRRLLNDGRDDLAAKVEWISQTCGDGLGFDILSFDTKDEGELYLEVKTTGQGKYFPFVVTENERKCSEDLDRRFCLYRVFDFARKPRVFELRGALSETCSLEAVQYRAQVGGS